MATTAIPPAGEIPVLRGRSGGLTKHKNTAQAVEAKRLLKVALVARDLRAVSPSLTAAERAEMHAIVAGGIA